MRFCKNCAEVLTDTDVVCPTCGYAKGTGDQYCEFCGSLVTAGAIVCEICGKPIPQKNFAQQQAQAQPKPQGYTQPDNKNPYSGHMYANQPIYAQPDRTMQNGAAQQAMPQGYPQQGFVPTPNSVPQQGFVPTPTAGYQQGYAQQPYGQPAPYRGMPGQPAGYSTGGQPQPYYVATSSKSRVVAGVLGILLGIFGAHNFYLGNTGKATAQLLLTVLTCFLCTPITAVWSFVESIMILTGSIKTDANGLILKD